jgi:hypothetical protein
MPVPAMNAEASLYKSKTHYRCNLMANNRGSIDGIYPQQCNPFFMTACMPILESCAYGWCWWNIGFLFGRRTCLACMDACIDAHLFADPGGGATARECKLCARLWPCA